MIPDILLATYNIHNNWSSACSRHKITTVSTKMEVKRSEDIHEDPWTFLEKELETFQQVLRELESGRN